MESSDMKYDIRNFRGTDNHLSDFTEGKTIFSNSRQEMKKQTIENKFKRPQGTDLYPGAFGVTLIK